MALARRTAVAWLGTLWLVTAAYAAPPVPVALLPMKVHALEEQAYLQNGIGDMLTSRLQRAPAIHVTRVRDAAKATTHAEEAQAAAVEAGAKYVLFGSFTRFGDGASLDLHCVPAEGDISAERSIFIQAGTIGEIIPQLDELADKVVRYVQATGGLPAVAAGPGGEQVTLDEVQLEIQTLRDRVLKLEGLMYGQEAEAVPEVELGAE